MKSLNTYITSLDLTYITRTQDINLNTIDIEHQESYKELITYILLNKDDDTNLCEITQDKIYEIFTKHFFTKKIFISLQKDKPFRNHSYEEISQDIKIKYIKQNLYKMNKIHDYYNDYSKLFRYLFTRIDIGNNKTGEISKYKLNLTKKELSHKNITFSKYIIDDIQGNNITHSQIRIDKQNLTDIIETMDKQDIKYLKLLQVHQAIKNNLLNIYYIEKESGRQYPNIANFKKEDFREILLYDKIELDLRAASFSYLYQVSKQINPDVNLETIKYLMIDKVNFRTKIAKILAGKRNPKEYIPIAKEVLTSLGFGAKSSLGYYEENQDTNEQKSFKLNAIGEILERENIPSNQFFQNSYIKQILKEFNTMMKTIYIYLINPINGFIQESKETYEHTIKSGKRKDEIIIKNYIIVKLNNKELKLEKKSKSKILAFLYQSFEAAKMQAIFKEHKKIMRKKGNKTVKPYHLHDAGFFDKKDYIEGMERILEKVEPKNLTFKNIEIVLDKEDIKKPRLIK